MRPPRLVLQTDHPWPDTTIERKILDAANLELVAPPSGISLSELIAIARGASAIMTCWAPVPKELINASPHLEIVARIGVGIDNIDVAAATKRGVVVTNVPDYCTEEVADHVVALVHAWARGVVFYDRDVRSGRWNPLARTLHRMSDLTIGVVGLGSIGTRVALKFKAIGCEVIGCRKHAAATGFPIPTVDLAEIAERSTVVTLHLPLNEQTRHIVDQSFLMRMRPEGLLVNTSRGALVDTEALIAALRTGRPSAAALDVVEGEPAPTPELLALANVIITPHVAFSSDHSVTEVRRRAAEEVVRVLSGHPPIHPIRSNRNQPQH